MYGGVKMSQIRMTPQELYDGATFISNTAQELENQLNALKQRVDTVTNNWEGAAQSSFVISFEELYKLFKEQFPPTVEGIAQQMQGAAQAIEQTDAELAKSFS
ncbi:WXG100 family type VII secretion target [Clostridium tertium]